MDPYETVDPDNDEVFISGLPLDTTEQEIADHFGQIGIIKQDKKRRGMPKVWMYKDKATGEFNGDATVTYEDPHAAASAPKWFDGKEFKGVAIKVSLSTRKAEAAAAYEKKLQDSQGGGREGEQQRGYGRRDDREWGRHGGRDGRGGYRDDRGGYRDDRGGGGRGGPRDDRGRGGARPGDWTCPSCGNNCFARKNVCNRCGTAKPYQAGGAPPSGDRGDRPPTGGRGGGGNRRDGDWDCACGNLCFGWRDSCNRCGAPKPGGAPRTSENRYDDRRGGNHRGRDGGGHHGHHHHHRDRSRSPGRH